MRISKRKLCPLYTLNKRKNLQDLIYHQKSIVPDLLLLMFIDHCLKTIVKFLLRCIKTNPNRLRNSYSLTKKKFCKEDNKVRLKLLNHLARDWEEIQLIHSFFIKTNYPKKWMLWGKRENRKKTFSRNSRRRKIINWTKLLKAKK